MLFNVLSAENNALSKAFKLNENTIVGTQEKAIAGNSDSAARLARYYIYSAKGDENLLDGYFWNYIAYFLHNYRSGIVLQKFLIDSGKTPPVDMSDILLLYSDKLDSLKSKDDIFSKLILYHYYLKIKDNRESEKYYKELKGLVDDRLLQSYDETMKNYPGGCLDRGFLLDKDEIVVYQQMALAGDGEKALELYLHYRFSHELPTDISKNLSNIFLYISLVLNEKNSYKYMPYFSNFGKVESISENFKYPESDIKEICGDAIYNYILYLFWLYSDDKDKAENALKNIKLPIDNKLLKKYKIENDKLVQIE